MLNIGLIGGMSWQSSLEYYRLMNEEVKNRLGGFHSAKIIMYSVDFQDIETEMRRENWDDVAGRLADAARSLERAGAGFIMIGTNTMHIVADQVQAAVSVPLIHIGDCTAEAVAARGIKTVGLLGTRFTMEKNFLKIRLAEKYGIETVVPDAGSRAMLHDIIFKELCLGVIRDESARKMTDIIGELEKDGARGVILGCTELPMLVTPDYAGLPLFDTTALHARRAVDLSLGEMT